MRILLLTDGIWPYVLGGMQRHSYYLCKYLARSGIQVHLVHFNQSQYPIEQLEFFSTEEKKNITASCLDFPAGPRFPGHYLYRSYQYSKLVYLAVENDLPAFDVIYAKGFTAWYLLKMKAGKKLTLPPVAVKFHGYEMFQKSPDLKTWFQMRLLLQSPVKWISRHADYVFSYGGKITDLILALGVERRKIVELPSGIESTVLAEKVTEAGQPLKFLFLGRYERRKGVEEITQALQRLLSEKKVPGFEMHFIGPIPESVKVQHQQVIYHGEIREKEELNRKIRNCDVLLCPSWSEGFPNVLLEAMGNGLTVIASDVGAVSVLVNAENGVVIGSSSAQAIQEAMLWFLNLPVEDLQRKKMAALSSIREKFTWEKLSGQLLQELQKMHA